VSSHNKKKISSDTIVTVTCHLKALPPQQNANSFLYERTANCRLQYGSQAVGLVGNVGNRKMIAAFG